MKQKTIGSFVRHWNITRKGQRRKIVAKVLKGGSLARMHSIHARVQLLHSMDAERPRVASWTESREAANRLNLVYL